MIVKQVYLKPQHPDVYRNSSGDGRITGVYVVKPSENCEERLCYQLTYMDGIVDYVPCVESKFTHLFYSK